MATTITITEESPFDFSRQRCYTSPSVLNAVWTERDWLRCEKLSVVAGPDIDQASFSMDVGYFPHRSDSPFDLPLLGAGIIEPLELNREYVKVEILDENDEVGGTWFGRLATEEQQVSVVNKNVDETVSPDGTIEVKTGVQQLTAFGLLWELEHTYIDGSYVKDSAGTGVINTERGIPFNFVERAGGFVLRGNHATVDGNDVFSWKPFSDNQWTAGTAIAYLCRNFPPKNATGNESLPLDYDGAALDWYDISLETDRRSVKSILDELVNRRRLAGYWLQCEEIGSSVFATIRVFTFTEADITVGSDTIPGNTDQIEIILRGDPLLAESSVRNVQTHVADRVVVEGGPITATISLTWDEMQKGWGSADETAYLAAAGGSDEDTNTLVRSRDAWRDVFSRFVAHDDFGGVTQGYNVTVQPEGIPLPVEDADVDALFLLPGDPSPWRFPARRFLDYTTIKDDVTDEFRRPFVLFPSDGKYVFAEQASVGDRNFSCNVSMLHDTLGMRLEVNRAGGNSLLAVGHVGGANAFPDELDPEVADNMAFDYEEAILTGTVEWDDRVGYEVVINATTDGSERVQRIMVEDARLDFVLPGTITDIDDAGALVISTGEVLTDDRSRLRTIATSAAQWYGSPRKAITLAYHSLKQFVTIGQIVTDLVTNEHVESVNTPITGIAFDFRKGGTTIETAYAEADFSVGRKGI
jgi:hypothetical protein